MPVNRWSLAENTTLDSKFYLKTPTGKSKSRTKRLRGMRLTSSASTWQAITLMESAKSAVSHFRKARVWSCTISTMRNWDLTSAITVTWPSLTSHQWPGTLDANMTEQMSFMMVYGINVNKLSLPNQAYQSLFWRSSGKFNSIHC